MVQKLVVKNQFGEESIFANVSDGVPLDNFGTVLFTGSGVPTNGVSGTGAGKAGPGSLYIDRAGKKLYINDNTLLSPTWGIVTSA